MTYLSRRAPGYPRKTGCHLLVMAKAPVPGKVKTRLCPPCTAAEAALIYDYDTKGERTGITALLGDLNAAQIRFKDLHTTQSSLEDIFVTLVSDRK